GEVALWFAPLAAGGRADADGVWVGPEGGRLGAALAAAGDVDGDGRIDLIVGAPLADAAYLVTGITGGTSPIAAVAASTLHGLGDTVAGAGDPNGDGYADVVAGACDPLGTSTVALFLGG
ncbi:MAG: VCBS repeat-containing protein, partial [Myxococcota bacterium]